MLTGVAQVDIIEHKKLEAQGKFKAGVEPAAQVHHHGLRAHRPA